MKFNYVNHLGDLELEAKHTGDIRLYNLPNGEWVPSITSVTSFYNREIFAKWRKKVGIEEANRVTKRATSRGTDFHEAVEVYMKNDEIDWDKFKPLTKFMFAHARPYLDKINNIHAIERTLYSEYLGLAGRVDCIAEYEGELAIIDFKTSEAPKKEQYLYDYFVQECGYACMLQEVYGLSVKKLVTIVACENGDTQVKVVPPKKEYLIKLQEYIREYQDKHDRKTGG